MPKKAHPKYIIGVDEAGRGPVAGPVTVGVLVVKYKDLKILEREIFPAGIRDSKKLSPARREEIFALLSRYKVSGHVRFTHIHKNAAIIDKSGITQAVRSGITAALRELDIAPANCDVRLDGLLVAPAEFKCQKTIIKGDETECAIALASIVAKVRRDRLMERLERDYPGYGFCRHKGYGTAGHYQALARLGLSPVHRRSYLKGERQVLH